MFCATAARSRRLEAPGSKHVPLWEAVRLHLRARMLTCYAACELQPGAVYLIRTCMV